MALSADMVTISVCMDREYVDRIDAWAKKLGHSRSKLVKLMLESGVDTDGWALDALTSGPGLFFLNALRSIAKTEEELGDQQAGMVPAA